MIRPLIENSIIPRSYPITINAVSGYSGGGRSLIERFETVTNDAPPIYFYGTTLSHKHLPEMQKYIGLENPPIFVPSVARYKQGMIVQVPIHLQKTWASSVAHKKFMIYFHNIIMAVNLLLLIRWIPHKDWWKFLQKNIITLTCWK